MSNDIEKSNENVVGLPSEEAMFRAQFQLANIGIAITRPDNRWVRVNRKLTEILGYPEPELLGKTWISLTHPDDVETSLSRYQRMVSGAVDSYEFDKRFVRRGGTAVETHVSVSCARHYDGSIRYAITSIQDISVQKQTERELREAQHRLEYILSVTKTGIDVVDAEFNLRYVDPGWQKVYGNYAGRKCYEYFMQRAEICPGCGIPQALQTRQITVTEETLPRENNRRVQVHTIPYQSTSGEWLVAEFNVDITDRHRMEADRLELERRLLHAQKLESLGLMAGGIAHDFNNLLMAIVGNLNIALLDVGAGSPLHASLDPALQASRRAADLTRQMLAYSGRAQFEIKRIQLNEVVRENHSLLQAIVPKPVTMRLDLSGDLPGIDADAAQLQQVVMNLITNAAEAIGDRPGRMIMATGVMACDAALLARSRVDIKPAPGRYVFLEVADTGCGMDAATLHRLFDPFFTTKFKGRGLGMSAVLGIVRGHHGAIMVDSVVGKGTTIRVLFPVAASPAIVAESGAGRGYTVAPVSTAPLSGTVLVVDDEPGVRDVARRMLERLGITVRVASDGVEAVECFSRCPDSIDCVLLDLTMPRKDGVATFHELRAIRPDIKVMVASGFSEQEVVRQFPDSSMSGFIHKPYELQDLEQRIRHCLQC
ncbi:MAG: hypothetical protein A2269_06555 [Lentisphaerae bacterium RIFOXYA12_FULL_60_10]|nr:MAG: hypothetical protein A2269_06555 [Lentisphaerae bacterium RIFOXYA12_FULL_60_10]